MNIFILNENPKKAAEYHCDKHVVKMIVESAQLLSTSHWLMLLKKYNKNLSDFKRIKDAKAFLEKTCLPSEKPPYKMTHVNHPCTKWACESIENYKWLFKLTYYLCFEYNKRYNKIHKTSYHLKWLLNNTPYKIPNINKTSFSICMKDEYKISSDPVTCYKEYYIKDKYRFAKWKLGNTPKWYSNQLNFL